MKQIVSRVLFGIAAILCVSSVAFAAGINSAEQSVISAVSQAFSYNGKTYVVKSESIAQGRAKLSEEGVDLTEADAKECINQFHQSYEELVAEGYCQEVAETDASEAPEYTTDREEPHSEAEKKANKLFLESVLGEAPRKKNSTETKEPVTGQKEPAATKKASENSDASITEDDWLEETELAAEMEFDKTDKSYAAEGKVVLKQGDTGYTMHKTDKESAIDRYSRKFLNVWKGLLAGVFVFSVLIVIVFLFYFRVAKKQHMRKGKKKFRCVLSVFTGICTAMWCFLIIGAFGLHFGVYNESIVKRKLMESNYYAGVTQMIQNHAAVELEKQGYDGELAKEIFALSNVYIGEKQYIEEVLMEEGSEEISIDSVHDILMEKLNQKPETDEVLITTLERDYQNILHFELGGKIRNSKAAWRNWFYLTVIAGTCIVLLLFFLNYKAYRQLYKAVRSEAFGILASSVLTMILAFLGIYRFLGQVLEVKPLYYQEFLQNYIRWDIEVFLYVGCLGMVVAAGVLIWRHYVQKQYE